MRPHDCACVVTDLCECKLLQYVLLHGHTACLSKAAIWPAELLSMGIDSSVTKMYWCLWLAHVVSALRVTWRPPTGVCLCMSVCVCGWGRLCANATDPKGIRLVSEGFQEAPGSCMHVCLYLLSCGPHAEFNCAARERYRGQIPWQGYPWFTHVTEGGREWRQRQWEALRR